MIAVIPTSCVDLDQLRNGSTIGFSFDPALIYLFDPETEENLI